jgi:RecA-family ATPase
VQGIWPAGASGIIGGQPKATKSTTSAELAVSLATGTPMFGLNRFPALSQPVPVLYVQPENTTGRVQRDLQQILRSTTPATRVSVIRYTVAQVCPDPAATLESPANAGLSSF